MNNIIVNVHVEPAKINGVTPMPQILDEIISRPGKLPKYMGPDAGYHTHGSRTCLETKGIQGVIAFTKSDRGRRIYSWSKETIERSFAEAKVDHGPRCARMLGIQKPCILS